MSRIVHPGEDQTAGAATRDPQPALRYRDPALKPGAFYWVQPVFDVDFTPPDFEGQECSDALFEAAWNHWSQREQPALFLGWTETGDEKWVYIGYEAGSAHPRAWWPVKWVGAQIALSDGALGRQDATDVEKASGMNNSTPQS